MSWFTVGKYEVRAWAIGHGTDQNRRLRGHWSVTDTTADSKHSPVHICDIERDQDADALNDALTAGRMEAERRLAADGGKDRGG